MQENFLITIKGTMEQRGDSDTVELMTRGSLVHKEGAYYIVYKETEATGYEGCPPPSRWPKMPVKYQCCATARCPASLSLRKAPAISAITRQATVPSAWASPPMSSSMN